MRIAVVGSGISGLVCAHLLHPIHDVTLFESDNRAGGHTHTHRVELPDGALNVDTGFLVYNERTYPLYCRLLDRLGVATQPSDMSFSVADEQTGIEWRGTSFATVFAQKANLARPTFLRMLVDIARFNRLARRLLQEEAPTSATLADFLDERRFSRGFLDWYLIPLGSSIWSADPSTFTQIPMATFVRFFERHGLLSFGEQASWRTVSGGAKHYVDVILEPLRRERRVLLGSPVDKIRRGSDGVEVLSPRGPELFDHVIVATHSDQALRMLADPDAVESELLGAIRYQPNRATLHTDVRLLPRDRRVWASWNYQRLAGQNNQATLTYYLNRLQGLETTTPILVTLNREEVIDPSHVLSSIDYAHPVLDRRAVAAQERHNELNGSRSTWFCGAYWGNGFHEDGVRSAVDVCRRFGATL